MITNEEAARKIFFAMQSQRFADWYATDYENFIRGELHAKSEDQILADITRLFKLDVLD